eukprot:TRINITY_DN2671_c0_g1_i1.p2 TRINITY_DN2671_c0_g1~~TRINITY_DN2671_c0_g1_i1.p2  ORF type:complete len:136 (-),score=15.71 TRINITY_DN2671_c0_g1_i1:10-417(-)
MASGGYGQIYDQPNQSYQQPPNQLYYNVAQPGGDSYRQPPNQPYYNVAQSGGVPYQQPPNQPYYSVEPDGAPYQQAPKNEPYTQAYRTEPVVLHTTHVQRKRLKPEAIVCVGILFVIFWPLAWIPCVIDDCYEWQ